MAEINHCGSDSECDHSDEVNDAMKSEKNSLVFTDDGHHGQILCNLDKLRKNGHFCDVTLQVGQNEVLAHKAVLATASGYLMDLFSYDEVTELSHFKLQDFTFAEFEILVNYVYTGRLEVPADDVTSVYKMSMRLKMARAAEACSNFLATNLDPENCIGIRACGSGYSDTALTKVCDLYIANNVQAVYKSKDCLALPRFQVEIVGAEDITIDENNEGHLCNLVLEWVRDKFDLEEAEDLNIVTENVHVLFLSGDNVLHDCKDMDHVSLYTTTEFVQDYKKFSKKRQATPGKGKKEGERRHVGDNPMNRKMDLLAGRGEQPPEKEWKIIAAEKAAEYQYMCVAILENNLATVSIHLRHRPETDVDGENGVILYPAVTCKSGSGSPTHDRQISLIPLAKMSCGRSGLGVTVLDGKIVAVGGYERGECLSSVEQYDPPTNKWSSLPDMCSPRGRFDATAYMGCLFACGGSNGHSELRSAETYDPSEKTWIPMGDMMTPRASTGTAVWRGKLFCIGGSNGQDGMKSCEMYDPGTKAWTKVATLLQRRSECGVCLHNDLIYAVGGCDSWHCLNTVEVYDPLTDRWQYTSPMNSCRRGAGVTAFNGKVYVIGGSDGQSSLATTEIYEPDTDTWTSGAPMVSPRVSLSCAVVDGRLYAVGGFNGKAFLDTIEYMDLETNEWCSYVPGEFLRS